MPGSSCRNGRVGGVDPVIPDGTPLHHALTGAYAALLARDTVGAAALLAPHLTACVPEAAPADPELIEAATVWAQLSGDGTDASLLAVRWARYGYDAARRLHGGTDWVTVRAGRGLAIVLELRGAHADAADVYAEMIAGLVHAGAVDEASLMTVHLAGAVHAAGRCDEAIAHLSAVWDRWRAEHGDTDRRGLPIVVRLAGLLAACGLRAEAGRRWAQARLALPPHGTPHRVAALMNAHTLMSHGADTHPLVCTYRHHVRGRPGSPPAQDAGGYPGPGAWEL